jgi:hypothetical protein
MADATNDTAELEARIARLDETIRLRERLDRLEGRARRGPGHGSPAAMRFREPPRPIAGSGGDDWERVREEFQRLGQYEKM